jgi:hypothetical protein
MNTALLARHLPIDPSYAIKSGKNPPMVLAHFNKHELEELDKAQGGKDIAKGTDIRQYKRLGEVFKNPHFKDMTLSAARQGHAMGGSINTMRHLGRHGDTEMALVPMHLADHFDSMMGKKSINPHTGKREYFDFSSLASGLGNMLSSKAAPAAGSVPGASGAAPAAGGGWGSMLGSLANSFLQPKPTGAPDAPASPNGQTPSPSWMQTGMNGLMSGIGSVMQARQNGGSWGDALKGGAMAGAGHFAQQMPGLLANQGGYLGQMMSNPMVQAGMNGVGGAANSYMQGNGFQNAISQGLNQGLSGFDNPYANAARNGLSTYQNGGNLQNSLMSGAMSGLSGFDNPYANAARNGLSTYQNGGNLQNSLMSGAMSGLGGMSNPYAQAASAGLNTYQNGGNLQDSLMSGGMNGLQSIMQQRLPQQQQQQQQQQQPQQQQQQLPMQNSSPIPSNISPIATNTGRKRRRAFGGPVNSFGSI